ncbi:MAG: hypothetical protein KKA16_02985 [Alphaproteobacteria bacterium]|nr:hypothetical protein [Alphaproteobacteria bacterium]MBU2378513.1 hypothetical protein [Alphaproteobacteria bacterium]
MKTLLTLGALAAIAVAAAGCGRMADLESPAPRQTERATRDARSPSLPDPATVNRPSSQVPVDGGANDLIGGTAAGREPQ